MPCFLKARSTTLAMSLSSAGRIWASISISITSVPKRRVGGGDLRARGAGADDGDLLRLLGQRPGAPGVDDAARRTRPRGSAARPSRWRGSRRRPRRSSSPTLTLPSAVERALALDHVDLVLVPEHLRRRRRATRRPRRGACLQRRPSRARRPWRRRRARRSSRASCVDLGRAQDRLRRDAGVVEAAAAGLVVLDDGGLLAQLGGADRGDVAAGAAADHDHVEGIWHRTEPIERMRRLRTVCKPPSVG